MFDCRDGTNIYQMADLIDDQIRSKRRSEEASGLFLVVAVLLLGGIILAPSWFLAKKGSKEALVAAIPLCLFVFGIFAFLITNIAKPETGVSSYRSNVRQPVAAAGPGNLQPGKPLADFKPRIQPAFEPVRMRPSFARIKRELPMIPEGLFVSPALRSLLADPDGFYVAQVEYRTLRKEAERLKAQRVPQEEGAPSRIHPLAATEWA